MNKTTLVGGIIVIIIIIAAGAYLLTMGSGASSQSTTTQQTTAVPVNTTAQNTSYTTAVTTIPYNITNSTPPNVNSSFEIDEAYSPTVGNYLVNSSGYTLYIFTADTPYAGNSTCYSSCATYWPPFYAPLLTVNPAYQLSSHDFANIARTGGGNETTYKGYPLYTYLGDSAAGQINGQGVTSYGGTWYAATYPNVTTT